ncbi:hypothetical protein Tco_0040604 [Tanacetum coccineum]
MDNPNITIEEYIRLEEEKARRRAIVFNDTLTSEATLSCEPTVISLNDEIDFRISFYEFDDEDCMVIFDKKLFSYKIISVNNLNTDSENDNDKVNMPLLPSPKPTVSYFNDLDYFDDFENEFPTIVYNDALTSKSDLLTEPILNPQHIDEFNSKGSTSFPECDEKEQNVLYFNDLFSFNIIYPNDSKSDEDNDDDKIDIEHSSGDLSVKPLPDLIKTDVGAYAHGSNKLSETIYTAYSLNEYGVYVTGIDTAYPGELVLPQYAVSIKKIRRIRAYTSPDATKDSSPIRRVCRFTTTIAPHCRVFDKKHQDSRIMKAQELKTKTSAQTLIYKIFLQRYQVYQGRLLASFQDDAKYEHVGQDTRSQGGKDDQEARKRFKDLGHKDEVERQ